MICCYVGACENNRYLRPNFSCFHSYPITCLKYSGTWEYPTWYYHTNLSGSNNWIGLLYKAITSWYRESWTLYMYLPTVMILPAQSWFETFNRSQIQNVPFFYWRETLTCFFVDFRCKPTSSYIKIPFMCFRILQPRSFHCLRRVSPKRV